MSVVCDSKRKNEFGKSKLKKIWRKERLMKKRIRKDGVKVKEKFSPEKKNQCDMMSVFVECVESALR
jgi:hypothetical protein